MADVRELLSKHMASELVFDKKAPMVDVEESTSLEDVLQVLHKHNIRAVPVYRLEAYGHKVYTGIVSTFDVVSYISFASYFREGSEALSEEERAKILSQVKLAKVHVKDVVGRVSLEGETLWTFTPEQTLLTVVEYFSKGVHRALVDQRDDNTGQHTYKLVAQTDVIEFLNKHQSNLESIANKRIEELNLCNPLGRGPRQRPLLVLPLNNTALEGFHRMQQERVQALPVVNESGMIVTTLSTFDAKGLNAENLKYVFLPVTEYLHKMHGARLLHPLTCSPRTLLGDIITQMATAQIHKHQIWVIDVEGKPIDVVSMTDVLFVLWHAVALADTH